MSFDINWITTRINEARKSHASVTEAVSDRMEELLKALLSERQLSKTELAGVARELITGMVPTPPEAEAKQ